jgi:hypothetical protein
MPFAQSFFLNYHICRIVRFYPLTKQKFGTMRKVLVTLAQVNPCVQTGAQ